MRTQHLFCIPPRSRLATKRLKEGLTGESSGSHPSEAQTTPALRFHSLSPRAQGAAAKRGESPPGRSPSSCLSAPGSPAPPASRCRPGATGPRAARARGAAPCRPTRAMSPLAARGAPTCWSQSGQDFVAIFTFLARLEDMLPAPADEPQLRRPQEHATPTPALPGRSPRHVQRGALASQLQRGSVSCPALILACHWLSASTARARNCCSAPPPSR